MVTEKVSKNKCCGCESCGQVCPAQCISFVEDEEGFRFPTINAEKCLNCNKCTKVCPALTPLPSHEILAGYAFRVKDERLLARTSSGGFVHYVAEKVISKGGAVFGAVLDDFNVVKHDVVESIKDLDKIRRSKYVQSRIVDAFARCKRVLAEGREVLFVGTPCQIKALNLFLGSRPENLLLIDFVCHGVPSPGVFRRYLSELADDVGANASDICEINFRSKELKQYPYSFSCVIRGKKIIEDPIKNSFLRGFAGDLFLRRSCHDCPARNFVSGSDYMVSDFWGINKILPDFPNEGIPGVSRVFVMRDKLGLFCGKLDGVSIMPFTMRQKSVVPCWAIESVPMTAKRDLFYKAIQHERFSIVVETLTRKSRFSKVINRVRHILKWVVGK